MTKQEKISRASLGGKARAKALTAKARKEIARRGYAAMIEFAVNHGALRRANRDRNAAKRKAVNHPTP